VIQSPDGNFYGVTIRGGTSLGQSFGRGTAFKMTPQGAVTTLYNFCSISQCTDGAAPTGLVQAADGNFYGTTNLDSISSNGGTVFKLTPQGVLTTLHRFCDAFNSPCPDGGLPNSTLIQATDGNLYGSTSLGGVSESSGMCTVGCGTVFKITPEGTFTKLYEFCSVPNGSICPDGINPTGGLVQGADGNLYGITARGGPHQAGSQMPGGTVFKIGLDGTFTSLYAFCAVSPCLDGGAPTGGLVLASDGNFYGVATHGGPNREGTVFKLDAKSGTVTTAAAFGFAGLPQTKWISQATDGNFYITNSNSVGGSIQKLSLSLKPFVKALPSSGAVGSTVTILGTKLTGATAVKFNGAAATFTVVSPTEITATVPTGATAGSVTVSLPLNKTLLSDIAFRVTP
jgi:uncharacterized repeat protein (TIGR03803 family)